MPIRIPWDEEEAAILINACIQFNQGKVTKRQVVMDVSKILRERAVNRGIEIDDVFRNRNGINMQFMLMNELLTDEKSGLRGASKLFVKIVEMYKNDRISFDFILKEAKTVTAETSIKAEFFKWLSNKVTATQLSDSYLIYDEIEQYCINKGILLGGIFGTTNIDMVNKTSRILASDKDFRDMHRRSLSRIRGMIYYYVRFLQDVLVDKSQDLEQQEIFEIVDSKNISGSNIDNDTGDNLTNTNDTECPYEDIEVSGYKSEQPNQGDQVRTKEKEYSIWLNSIGNETDIILVSLMDLSKMSDIAFRKKISDRNILLIDSPSALRIVKERLQRCDEFLGVLPQLQRQYIKTLDTYIEYKIKSTITPEIESRSNEIEKINVWSIKGYLEENNLESIVDSRNRLWVLGGQEIRCEMIECWRHELSFRYKEHGSAITNNLPAWVATLSDEDYHMFMVKDKIEIDITEGRISVEIENTDNEMDLRLSSILKDRYENGFRINSAIDKGRFFVFFKEKYGQELELSGEELELKITKIGSIRENRIYAKQEDEQMQFIKGIFESIMSVFESGASCVYEDSVYNKYEIILADKYHIYNANELGNLLLSKSCGRFRKKHTFICLKKRQSDLKKDVLTVLKKSPIPMNYDDIQKIMWYIPINKVKQIMINIESIAYVAPETYFYAPNLPISSEELMNIKKLIYKFLEIKTHMTDVELRTVIEEQYPSVAINTADYTTYGLRNSLAYILRDEFSFKGAIISNIGKEIGMSEVFAGYCKERKQIKTEELKELALDMKTVIYWDSVRDVTIRISDNMLMRDDQIIFDIEVIDKILDEFVKRDYVTLKNIGLFLHFPVISIPWNGYVLESYLYKYSKKFKLLHSSFSASGYFGAMVRQESIYDDYRTMIIDALAHSKNWIDRTSALEFLVVEGYQQRRRYEGIENVIVEAQILREKIKETRKWG